MSNKEEPVIGIPCTHTHQDPLHHYYFVNNQPQPQPQPSIFGDPKQIPIHQTFFRDSPAPFNCPFCSHSGLTTLRSKPSLAAVVGCMMPMFLGICFLCPSMDCLWHKYHYCPSCNEKVGEFEKSDPCAVMDPPHWIEQSFALPA